MSGISLDFKDNPVVVPGDGTGKEVGNILDRDHNAYLNRLYLYNGTNTRTQISASGGGSFVTNLGVDNIQPAGAIPFGSGVAKDVASDGTNLNWDNATKTLNVKNITNVAGGVNNFGDTNITNLNVTGTTTGLANIVQSTNVTDEPARRISLVATAPNAGKIKTLTLGPNMSFTNTEAGNLLIDSLAGGGGGVAPVSDAGGVSLVAAATSIRSLTSPNSSVTRVIAGNDVQLETNITSAGAGTTLLANGRQTRSLTSTGTSVTITNTGTTVNLEVNPTGIVTNTNDGVAPLVTTAIIGAPAGRVKGLTGAGGIVVTDNGTYVSISPNLPSYAVHPLFIAGTNYHVSTMTPLFSGPIVTFPTAAEFTNSTGNGSGDLQYYFKGIDTTGVGNVWQALVYAELSGGVVDGTLTYNVYLSINGGAFNLLGGPTVIATNTSTANARTLSPTITPQDTCDLRVTITEAGFPHSVKIHGISVWRVT
jgi:hypothetical protein